MMPSGSGKIPLSGPDGARALFPDFSGDFDDAGAKYVIPQLRLVVCYYGHYSGAAVAK